MQVRKTVTWGVGCSRKTVAAAAMAPTRCTYSGSPGPPKHIVSAAKLKLHTPTRVPFLIQKQSAKRESQLPASPPTCFVRRFFIGLILFACVIATSLAMCTNLHTLPMLTTPEKPKIRKLSWSPMAAMFSGCPGPPNEDKERVATNEMSQPSEMSLKAKDRVAAVRPNQLSLTSRTNGQSTGGSNDTTAANTTSAGIDPDLKSAPAPPSPVPSPRLLQKHSPRRPKLSPTLSPQLQTSDNTVAGSPHFLPEGSKATDSSLTPDPALPVSPVNTAVGQHPSPKVFEAAKDAAPPDRGGVQLDFGSEGTENTNDARGDHGCGLSGAQATAPEAVYNPANTDDFAMATTFIYLSDHHPLCPCFPPDPFCPCPQSPPHPPEPLSSSTTQAMPE